MKPVLHIGKVPKYLLIVNLIALAAYMAWWFNLSHADNLYLYGLLFFGEIYHAVMALTFWHTLWPGKAPKLKLSDSKPPTVDIFITVTGEPVNIVAQTALGAANMRYPNTNVYLLNDSYVAKKENWREYEILARQLGINCITRKVPGGAKAGNINHALGKTKGDLIVIFDADMVPHPDFLENVMPYFSDPKTGFVQTPQFYKNARLNYVTGSAWEQQELFFGPIMKGKEKSNAAFICGTNVIIRREALDQVGGMNEKNIAEDFLTSLQIHQKGWKSYYVPKVLAEGLAPEDLLSYFKQQLRWARGSLEVLFGANPIFKPSLTFSQKTEYLSSALYYFNGVVVLIDIIMPLVFLFTGVQPVSATTTSFAILFVPFMALSLLTLYLASAGTFSFRAIAFSQASWTLQLMALVSVILRQKMGFAVTPKRGISGDFTSLAYPHILYAVVFVAATIIALNREGLNPAVVTNIAWGLFNVIMFWPFIYASFNWRSAAEKNLSLAHKI